MCDWHRLKNSNELAMSYLGVPERDKYLFRWISRCPSIRFVLVAVATFSVVVPLFRSTLSFIHPT